MRMIDLHEFTKTADLISSSVKWEVPEIRGDKVLSSVPGTFC